MGAKTLCSGESDRKTDLYSISNGNISCSLFAYGCTLQSLRVPDSSGNLTDVVLGFGESVQYSGISGRIGATIGRYANRIRNGRFSIGKKLYQLSVNRFPNHIHGGVKSFDKKVWNVAESGDDYLRMSLVSEDGEEGYPGRLDTSVTYSLRNSTLEIKYEAVSDKDTICNLTNHSYFNLSGKGTIDGHKVMINSSRYVPTDDQGLPSGGEADVSGYLDLRSMKPLSHSYDTCFILDSGSRCASCLSEETGIRMDICTDMPAIQLYTGDNLKDAAGKNGTHIGSRSGVCFETEFPPDSPNGRYSDMCLLRAGKKYEHFTSFEFGNI